MGLHDAFAVDDAQPQVAGFNVTTESDRRWAENMMRNASIDATAHSNDVHHAAYIFCAPFFTNRVIMLQDYEHMITVGCVMGKGFDPIAISGYAKFLN